MTHSQLNIFSLTIKDKLGMLSNDVALELYLIDIVRFAVAAAAVLVLSRI